MFYWRIRTGPINRGGMHVYIKVNRKYIPEMIVDIAIRTKMLLDVFEQEVDEIIEVTQEEYFKYMWE